MVPVCGTNDTGKVVPTAATQHTVFTIIWSERIDGFVLVIGSIPIPHPFPDIACHVQRSIRTGSFRIKTNFCCVSFVIVIIY